MKKLLFFIFLYILMIGNVNALKITSLGDSIPNGYLLSDKEKSYDNMLAKTLGAEFYEYSISGMITDDLVKALDKEELKQNIENSDIVFINIGSGDLLDLIDDIDLSKFGFNGKGKIDIKSVSVADLKDYLVDSFTNKLAPKVEQVVNNFSSKFEMIVDKIKTYNPKAKIYVNNAYNPFFDVSIPVLLNLSEIEKITEEAIKTFNNVLNQNNNYSIIDIYSVLRNKEYLNIDPLNGLFDPHPNELGHEVIYKKYLKELCYKITYDGKDYYVLKGDKFDIKPKEKKGYTFLKWNYDLNNIDKDIGLKEIYKKNINYLYFIIPGVVLIIIIILFKTRKKSFDK